jgi:tripartite-type tricarboxylate transporter receptor subunit TctC
MRMLFARRLRLLAPVTVISLLAFACASPADDGGGAADDTEEGEEPEEASEEDLAAFYEGEQIEFIVPFAAGGGSDVQARFMAPYLTEHLPGNPDVQVVNIDGGSGIIGSNQFALQTEPDGMTTLFSSGSSTFPYLLRDPAVEFDYQEMIPAFGLTVGAVAYTSPDTGIEEAADLATTDAELVIGEQGPTSLGAVFLLAWELLDVDVQAIMGYEGRGPARVAFEQGETNLDWQTLSAYRSNVEPLIDAGEAVPLFSAGQVIDGELERDPAFEDLPTVKEVYEEIHGEEPSGEAWDAYLALVSAGFTLQKVVWLHDEVPPEAVQAWRDAGVALENDDEMWENEGEEILEYPLVVGDEIEAEVEALLDVDEATVDWLVDFLNENYDAGIEAE